MPIFFCIFITTSLLICHPTGDKEIEKEGSSVVKQVDHILLVQEDPRGLYDFLTKDLGLPVAWQYRKYKDFESGGVFAGNVNLEALSLLSGAGSAPSKIAGFAFEPSSTTDEIIKELDRRQIAHEEPQVFEMGPEGSRIKLWTNTIIENMLPGSFVFICEYHIYKLYKVDAKAMRRKLKNDLEKADGGTLGIKYVSEIKIKLKDKAGALKRWQNLLKPYECFKDGCFGIGKGPSLRFMESDQDYIYSLKIKVKSIKKAGDFLSAKGLVRTQDDHTVITNPEKTFGILFEFSEIEGDY